MELHIHGRPDPHCRAVLLVVGANFPCCVLRAIEERRRRSALRVRRSNNRAQPDGSAAAPGPILADLFCSKRKNSARAYLSAHGGAFERLTERADIPSFSDKTLPQARSAPMR